MAGMRYQPQGIARLDSGNPLARGISDVWVASTPATLVKKFLAIRTGSNLDQSGIAGFGVAGKFARGDGAVLSAGFQISDDANGLLNSGTTTWFIVRRCRDTVVRPIYMHYGYDNGANNRCLLGAPEDSSITWDFGNATAGSGRLQAPYTKDTQLETLVLVAGPVKGREIWRRGIKLAGNPAAKAQRSADSASFGIGRVGGNTASDDVETYMIGVSNREWSDAEIIQWCRNPWQILDDTSTDEFVSAVAASYLLSIEPAATVVGGGAIGMRIARRLRAEPASLAIAPGPIALRARRQMSVSPAALAIAGSGIALLSSRRLGVLPAAMAATGGQVVARVSRRLSVTPAAMGLTGGQVSMLYAQKPEPGSYTLPVSAAAMALTGGKVGMRIARRLRVEPASLLLVGGAVGILVRRRMMVSPAGLQLVGGSVTLRPSARGEPFDITKIHPSRIVIFEGSGSRVTPFEGSGSRVTSFGSTGTRKVRFE